MEAPAEQQGRIARLLSRQQGNVTLPDLRLTAAIPFVPESACNWRVLPKRLDTLDGLSIEFTCSAPIFEVDRWRDQAPSAR